jgi:hypothetical protein
MRHFLYASVALPFFALPAMANPHQVNHSGNQVSQAQVWGDGSSANSNQAYGGSSSSTAYGGRGGHGGHGGNAASTQNVNVNDGGGRVEASAPSMMIPNIAGGTNECLGGVGFGGAGKPGGGLFSYTWEMHDCRERATGVMLWNAGYKAEAVKVWCHIPEVREAFRRTPQQCPEDGPLQTVAVANTPASKTEYKYDWCYTASAGERKQHKECILGVN